MRRLALALLVLMPAAARAGAWTQDQGHWQIISSFDVARANSGFDGHSHPDAPIRYDKVYSKMLVEYGWSDKLTLIFAPEFVVADYSWAGATPVRSRDVAVEAGARLRLTDAFGTLALQATYKSAGPADLSNSIGQDSARIAETRFLYGTGFQLFGRDGFADLEIAERWVSAPRPNETVLDGTAGLWFGSRTMVMLQSFNVMSGGDAEPPYTYFRMHKLELSLVRCFSPRWSLQIGGYLSPAGQNSLVEQGIEISIWTHL